MDRDAMLHLLRKSTNNAPVPISNIPYDKTILERHVIDSLSDDETESSPDGAKWISIVQEQARHCPSLSAMDLMEIAEQTGFRVELSWARQKSQHGGVDAVFHQFEQSKNGSRMMIRFPTDDDEKPPSDLTSRPLQRLQSRRIEAQLREWLQRALPSYMVPARIIMLDNMPVNTNGKVDRRKLSQKARTTVSTVRSTTVRVAPRNLVEAVLCDEFTAVLGIEVGITDNFFELGGHSLMATKLAARLSRRLDIKVSVKEVFAQPIVGDLAAILHRGSSMHRPITSTPYDKPVEQSYAQNRLWFLDQLNVGGSSYLMPLATRLRGVLDIDALTVALHALEQRHETLRTTFEEHDGVGMQIVHESDLRPLKVIDLSFGLNDSFIEPLLLEQTTPFDLTSEPGWRVALLRLGEKDHILSIVMHHIASDGWSIDVLRKELGQFYTTAVEGEDPLFHTKPLPIQYRDFSAWQKQEEQLADHQRQLDYWTEQLADSVPGELLSDKPRPAVLSSSAGTVPLVIEGQVYEKLQAFCTAQEVTVFTVLLAAFRAAHFRLTGAEDATIGTPIANRNRSELEDMIGFFVNTQCIRIVVEEGQDFEGLVQEVRSATMSAFENQDVPFERIVSALIPGSRDTSRNPLMQLMFALHSQHSLGRLTLEGLDSEPIPTTATTRLDVEFHLFQDEGRLNGSALFATDLFEAETVQGVVSVFHEILRRGLDQPQTPIAFLPLTDGMSELERMQLLDIHSTDYPRDSSVVDVFRDQVSAYPDTIAVKDSSSQLTYRELEEISDELSAWLRQRQYPTGTLIGVLAPRSCEAIATFLGIIKADLAYLPLDINVPAARVEAILSAVPGQKLVLTGKGVTIPDIQLLDVEWMSTLR